MEAAARGLIDFSEARFFDPTWQRRVNLALFGLRMINAKEKAELRHRHYCALLASKALDLEKADEVQSAAIEQVYAYEGAFLPNAKKIREEAEQEQIQARVSGWESHWGKMSDPKTQERIRQTAEALRTMRIETAQTESQGSIEGLMSAPRRQQRNARSPRR